MAKTIKLKRSAIADKIPLTSDLALGEIGLNTWDGKLFVKLNDGVDQVVEVGARHIHFYRYNSAVQTFTAVQTIDFNVNGRTDTGYTVATVGGGTEITIVNAGWYKVQYDLSIDNAGTGRRRSNHQLELNAATIAISTGYHRNASQGAATGSATVKLNLAVNDVLRVRASGTSSVKTIINGCHFNIESID